jgi:hypothetical protein
MRGADRAGSRVQAAFRLASRPTTSSFVPSAIHVDGVFPAARRSGGTVRSLRTNATSAFASAMPATTGVRSRKRLETWAAIRPSGRSLDL